MENIITILAKKSGLDRDNGWVTGHIPTYIYDQEPDEWDDIYNSGRAWISGLLIKDPVIRKKLPRPGQNIEINDDMGWIINRMANILAQISRFDIEWHRLSNELKKNVVIQRRTRDASPPYSTIVEMVNRYGLDRKIDKELQQRLISELK